MIMLSVGCWSDGEEAEVLRGECGVVDGMVEDEKEGISISW